MIKHKLNKIFLDRNRCELLLVVLLDLPKHTLKVNSHVVSKQFINAVCLNMFIDNIEYEADNDWNIKIDVTINNNIEIKKDATMQYAQIQNAIDELLQREMLCTLKLNAYNNYFFNIRDSSICVYVAIVTILDDNFYEILKELKKRTNYTISRCPKRCLFVLFVHDIKTLLISSATLKHIFSMDNIKVMTFEEVFPHEYNVFSLINSDLRNYYCKFEILKNSNKQLYIENATLREENKRLRNEISDMQRSTKHRVLYKEHA